MFNRRIHEIRWIELFFDIILVLGVSQIIQQITFSSHMENFVIEAIILSGFLLDIWVKVMLFENKINIVKNETDVMHTVNFKFYPNIIYLIFGFCIVLIYYSSHGFANHLPIIIISMVIIRLLLSLLVQKKVYLTILLIIALPIYYLFGIKIVEYYLLVYQVILFTQTYRSFYTIELNYLLIPKNIRPRFKLAEGKFSFYHILERLGILMIVFMAEYFITLLHLNQGEITIYTFIILMIYPYLFFLSFFSKIDHFKNKDYIALGEIEKTVYFLFLYYISISFMEIFVFSIIELEPIIIYLILSEIIYFIGNILLEIGTTYMVIGSKRKGYHIHNSLLLVVTTIISIYFGIFNNDYVILLTFIIIIHLIDLLLTERSLETKESVY